MKIIRYFFVGGIAAITDLIIFFIFAKLLNFPYLLVGACGFIIATIVNYLLSIRFVFTSGARFGREQEVLLIYAISLIGLLFHQLILYLFIDQLSIEMMTSKVAAILSVFIWNFSMRNNYVFKGSRNVL